MTPECIVPASAGPLAVAAVAMVFTFFQGWLATRQLHFIWNAWGGALSLSVSVYGLTGFCQFNSGPTPINHIIELIQYSTFVCIVHSAFGFSFAYLGIPSGPYHRVAGPFHVCLLLLLWTTNLVVLDSFVAREFLWQTTPYIEPDIGVLGPAYLLYCAGACLWMLRLWIQPRHRKKPGATAFLIGFLFWITFAVHDAIVTMGVRSVFFLMEYGFLGFVTAIMSVTVSKYAELFDSVESSNALLKNAHDEMEKRVTERTLELTQLNQNLSHEISERLLTEEELRKNITERVRVEQEILNLNQTLQSRVEEETNRRIDQERLMASNVRHAAMGEMIGAIAHQWRQPLNTLGMIVQRAHAVGTMQGLTLEYLDEFKANAMRQIKHMSGTIEDFRSFYRVEIEKEPFSPSHCIFNAIRLIEPQFTSRGIKIDKHVHDFDSLQSVGFPNEFMQVILNLFSNSRDAILQRRKIDGQPEVGRITINLSVRGSDRIIIHIKDNGCGIPAGLNARIFDPYFTTKEEGEGTGIGLYMSRVIVEDHHDGRIRIAESLDGGTIFIIELPLRKEHDPS
jgi:signal transduction histidine kinase